MKKIAIFTRTIKQKQRNTIIEILRKLDAIGVMLVLYHELYNEIKDETDFSSSINLFKNHKDIEGCSFLLSIGGDGTLLETINFIRDSGIPVLGLNIGKLGFLANSNLADFENAINEVLNNNYEIDKRTLIKIDTSNLTSQDFNYALNDITITKSNLSSMIKIDVHINNSYLNTYWADGIIIATPTGSTAYSLSCGGPIVVPESKNLILTPIASHNLTVRPIVIPDSSIIKLTINSESIPFLIHLDSRKIKINKKAEIKIIKENFSFNLIKLKDDNFFATIRNKLMWGIDKRN